MEESPDPEDRGDVKQGAGGDARFGLLQAMVALVPLAAVATSIYDLEVNRVAGVGE